MLMMSHFFSMKPTAPRLPRVEDDPVVNGESTIINQLGLHARPAMAFVQLANGFASTVRVRRANSSEWVDGKSIMQMLLLAATAGTVLEISCEGTDETRALEEILKLINQKFDEE